MFVLFGLHYPLMSAVRVPLPPRTPEGLSRRARGFVETHGMRLPCQDLRPYRDVWLEHGIPAAEIDRAVAFQEVWGGIALPPAPAYEGGPRVLEADFPEDRGTDGWCFSAGDCRVSMGYGFMIGPGGEFGIDADHWTPLHSSTQGWVEALALAHHAGSWAQTVTKIKGDAVEEVDLDGFEPVPEVRDSPTPGGGAKTRSSPSTAVKPSATPLPAACRPTSIADSTHGASAATDPEESGWARNLHPCNKFWTFDR